MDNTSTSPASIEAERTAGTLAIQWDDGHQSTYSLVALRWACPCAICRGEWGRPGVLESIDTLPAPELLLTDIHMVGSYAIMPTWASGHSTGIYTFEYLRSLCPCGACPKE